MNTCTYEVAHNSKDVITQLQLSFTCQISLIFTQVWKGDGADLSRNYMHMYNVGADKQFQNFHLSQTAVSVSREARVLGGHPIGILW